jgi:chromosome partitioning protein
MKKLALISQSGNVMKSTLACAIAVEAANNNLNCSIADLDIEHRTSYDLSQQRKEFEIQPPINVIPVNSAVEALNCFTDEQLQIIDAPSRASEATIKISQNVDLIVQPTPPSKKDMDLAINTFYQLAEKGIPNEKMLFVITRVGSEAELKNATKYLNQIEIDNKPIKILSSAIYEKVGYRIAINDGYGITQTTFARLNDQAKSVVHQIITCLLH